MKKLIMIFLMSLGFLWEINAQEFQSFKTRFGIGYATAGDSHGVTFMFEPVYHLNDELGLGLRLGFADTEVDIFGGEPIGSYTLNGQYFFSTTKMRPFVGLGLGFYVPYRTPAEFGYYPRIGFEVNHFFLMLEYNAIPKSESYTGHSTTNSYFALTIGLFAGGARKIK